MSNFITPGSAHQHSAEDVSALKRKRSPSLSQPALPPAKAAKTTNQLSINYLARLSNEDLPLATKEDTLPNLLHLLGLYGSVLDRHESIASNLGARPLGPILIKRFERCFDASPKVVASHHKNVSDVEDPSLSITWLEVIEFARAHPSQFTLSTFSEGQRVCQFYLPQKQLRVQISEEDFIFINSGRCQELIPPLPIWEDEEKEVSTCDVLDARLKELTNVADMVAARTRQLCHRLKGRRAAILERRAEGGSGTPAKAGTPQTTTTHPSSSGFTAVNNNNNNNNSNGKAGADELLKSSASMRTDLLRHFESLPQNQTSSNAPKSHETAASHASPQSPTGPNGGHHGAVEVHRAASVTASSTPRQSLGSTGTSKHNFSRPLPPAMESSQPFRPLCQAHMDALPRGQRVLPPCDRCRRLRMDCVKNLTSCAGCTKKHARCHWRDVNRDELRDLDHLMTTVLAQESNDEPSPEASDSDEDDAMADLLRMGEQAQREHEEELARRRRLQASETLNPENSARAEEDGNGNKLLNAFDTSPKLASRDTSNDNRHPVQTPLTTKHRDSPGIVQDVSDDSFVYARYRSVGGFRPVNPSVSLTPEESAETHDALLRKDWEQKTNARAITVDGNEPA